MTSSQHILIHTVGKVGTWTIINACQKYFKNSQIHWSHCLRKDILLETILQAKNHNTKTLNKSVEYDKKEMAYYNFLTSSLNQAAKDINIIEILEQKTHVNVITVIRNPYHHMISSVLHHAEWFFPKLFQEKIKIEEKCNWLKKRIENIFINHVTNSKKNTSEIENKIIHNMTRGLDWWSQEFYSVHHIDILQLEKKSDQLWQLDLPSRKFFIFKFESLNESLPRLINCLTPEINAKIPRLNESRNRPGDWGQIYKWIKTEYHPPQQMIDFYESQALSKKFYPQGLL